MTQQPQDPNGMIQVSLEAVVDALRTQRNAALDGEANWRAAYTELASTYTSNLLAYQTEIVSLRAQLVADSTEATGPTPTGASTPLTVVDGVWTDGDEVAKDPTPKDRPARSTKR